jgi:hypothetical protein
MFAKAKSGVLDKYPYTVGDLRRDNPNTSFPKYIPEDMLAAYDVYPVTRGSVPTFDSLVQSLVAHAAPTVTEGQWTLGYDVAQKSQDMAGNNVRLQRNRLLSATDWMALSDNTMTPEWASYRQALRDITSQGGFPYTIEWPTKPGE